MIELIVGLPCSGKTHLCKSYETLGYKIYDDFLSTFYNGELLYDLGKYDKICIADPRLCVFETFLKIITQIRSRVSEQQVHITLYENDQKCCLKNLEERGGPKKEIAKSIVFLSGKYLLTNYVEFDHTIIPVYKK